MKGRVPDIRDTREPLVAPLSLLKAGKADRLRRKSKAFQSMRLSQGLTSIPSPPNQLVRLLLTEHIRPAPHSVEMFSHHDSNDDYMPLRVTACPHPLSSQGVI